MRLNSELLFVYWNIGKTIEAQQKQQGWGTKVGFKLTDATGRVVFNENVSANGLNFRHDIDTKNLASGVYMLLVNVEGKTTVKRIVKQ